MKDWDGGRRTLAWLTISRVERISKPKIPLRLCRAKRSAIYCRMHGQRTRSQGVTSTMTKTFGATSTTEDVLSGIDLRGKRILVTGVSAGLGVETARSLAAHGAQVVGTARDLAKAESATAQVRKDAITGGGSFKLI